jgi:DNA-binding MarR family transcriptional regulator/ribosomal protein S18 acetylase RimI-like enzyme
VGGGWGPGAEPERSARRAASGAAFPSPWTPGAPGAILLTMSTNLAVSAEPGAAQPAAGDSAVAAVREFNRFYTNVIGLLREGLLDTPYSLTEARVIFELARADDAEVAELRAWLDIDRGYLSRILARFEADGLVTRRRSASDGRRQVISLTEPGRSAFRNLDDRSAGQIGALLAQHSAADRRRLTVAMATIREVIDGPARPAQVTLRAPEPGDLGWVIQAHGALYAGEYGWDATFEALVARIVADYAAGQDPRRERAWIAEAGGRPAGCIFCVRKSDTTAQLRLLLVEPWARGMGIGESLVAECLAFARGSGYAEIVLWTQDVLAAARRIYQRAGFQLVEEGRHHSFGHDLVEQTWRLDLG